MDNERPHEGRPRWQRAGVILASTMLLATLGLCMASGIVLGSRHARLPNIARQVGPVRLVAHETVMPQCAFGMPCAAPLRSFEPARPRYYVVWVMICWPNNPDLPLLINRLLAEPLSS